MHYHASLITADGAYHCPVGSIMAIFLSDRGPTYMKLQLLLLDQERKIYFHIWSSNIQVESF